MSHYMVGTELLRGLLFALAFTFIAIQGFAGNKDLCVNATLEFKKDRIIGAAYFTVKKGKDNELKERYFEKVAPIAEEYDIQSLGKFKINSTEYGPDKAEIVFFFDYPNMEAKKSFEQDPRLQKLIPIRDSLLDHLKVIFLSVDQDTKVNFKDQDHTLYNLAAGWINKTHAQKLDEYFAIIGPDLDARGVNFLAVFNVIGSPEQYYLEPSVMMLVEWPNSQAKVDAFEGEAFKKAGYLRALALDQLYIVEVDYMDK